MREFTRVQPIPKKKVVMLSCKRRKETGGNGREEIATKRV
jgi:hypothetical protein